MAEEVVPGDLEIADELIAEGTITAVCCYLSHESEHGVGSHLTKTRIPDSIRKLLARHQ